MADTSLEVICILDDPPALARSAADILFRSALTATNNRIFNVSFCGGSTPRHMHRMLAGQPYLSAMPWEKLHLFWVDERCVPVDDQASNYGTAKSDLIDNVPLAANQVHPMPGQIAPGEGAGRYEKELVRHFRLQPEEFPRFDLMVLGVGHDGHTASLFPGHPALKEKKRMVLAVKGGQPYVNRLTLTLPVINQADKILVLVSGKGKARVVKRIFEGKEAGLPVQEVQPEKGKLIWLLDQEAASLLQKKI